ncbi:MAG TPA: MBL fold metallo-hydrolase [Steroidobacteraceae bacterium]|nr:MBL fold metallo-hydrolase [Steroidobacteraceae bacterium]
MATSRRGFLQGVLGSGAAGLCDSVLSRRVHAAPESRETHYATTELAPGLWLISGGAANIVAARAPDGLILVDGGAEPDAAELQRVALRDCGARRITTLFNTHWHPEQTGSNLRLGKAGAQIIAHEKTRLWLTQRIVVDWRPGSYGPLPAAALPKVTTYDTGTLSFGTQHADYGHLGQAHTDGDLYVLFREANVLVAGGVVSSDRWPILDWQTGGWIAGLVGAHDRLIKVCNEQTRIIPANGPPISLGDLKLLRAMYFTVYQRLVKALTSGLSPAEAVALHPAHEFQSGWGSPDQFIEQAFKSQWPHQAPNA